MAPTKQRQRGHDRGQVLADLAMIADGGDAISDLAVLRAQPDLFGNVASTPTAWRTLEAIDSDRLSRIAVARADARKKAWAAGTDPGFSVIDFDATLITAHSEKQGAATTYKRGFGYHPLLAFLDATGEALGGILRPGNAGSNTAADHLELLKMALVQLPVDPEAVPGRDRRRGGLRSTVSPSRQGSRRRNRSLPTGTNQPRAHSRTRHPNQTRRHRQPDRHHPDPPATNTAEKPIAQQSPSRSARPIAPRPVPFGGTGPAERCAPS